MKRASLVYVHAMYIEFFCYAYAAYFYHLCLAVIHCAATYYHDPRVSSSIRLLASWVAVL
ncbi:hypothetical protein Pdsh_08155 [Pyrodictium delaneyi]|uniref:Uncharacterized protein n=1 Tax=Pyrodictium delaneyi TaxID=1273541 RepID=A0A211YN68_9CREN|nr:hypothetical protein Pdsh_08155 [Pyrodictium delaneyi]